MSFRLALLTALLSGCAIHAATELHNSQQALRDAERADTGDHALYERTKAELWLLEARREAAYSRYKSSVELAREARAYAEQAVERARAAPPAPAATEPSTPTPRAEPASDPPQEEAP